MYSARCQCVWRIPARRHPRYDYAARSAIAHLEDFTSISTLLGKRGSTSLIWMHEQQVELTHWRRL